MDAQQKLEYFFDTLSFWSKWGIIEQEQFPKLKTLDQLDWKDLRYGIQRDLIRGYQRFITENFELLPEPESLKLADKDTIGKFLCDFYEKISPLDETQKNPPPNLSDKTIDGLKSLVDRSFNLALATEPDVIGLVALEYLSRKKIQGQN